jgi:hypothetical protein
MSTPLIVAWTIVCVFLLCLEKEVDFAKLARALWRLLLVDGGEASKQVAQQQQGGGGGGGGGGGQEHPDAA